jgi:hypothetical protein
MSSSLPFLSAIIAVPQLIGCHTENLAVELVLAATLTVKTTVLDTSKKI